MFATDIPSASLLRRPIRRLLKAAGRARPATDERSRAQAPIEQLEPRVMLSGDHPSYNEVFLLNQQATAITLDAQGAGASAGTITPALDNDMFRFTAPANDFVRVWADALNSGNVLDSRVQIYHRDANNNPVPDVSGSNNGTLTSGVFKDGWVGFKAVVGREYFVQVLSDLPSGLGSTGTYTVRVNARSIAFPVLDAASGDGTIDGSLTRRGGDVVYSLRTGSQAAFNSLITIASIRRGGSAIDTRLDIYDAAGNPLQFPDTTLVFDDDSGNLNDSFLAYRALKSTTYYVRVRADKTANIPEATGNFTVNVDGIGDAVAMDPVTRLGNISDNITDEQHYDFFTFQAQGTGRTFISLAPTPGDPAAIPDSAIRLYDDTGKRIAFNELPGPASQIVLDLVGGRIYHVVFEDFDWGSPAGAGGGDYIVEIEAHHTFDTRNPPTAPVLDDHVSTPPAGASADVVRRTFEMATPIVWSDPQDYVNNFWLPPPETPPPADRSKVVLGHAMGRIYAGGDTDLFQFVPPVDMLGDYGGLTDRVPPPPMGPGPAWLPDYFPASRLQIFVNSTPVGFINTRVRLYDSNFTLMWTNGTVFNGFTDPSGALDPASWPPPSPVTAPLIFNPPGIRVWGGEVYYLEVSAEGGGGRYDVEVQADAASDTNDWTYEAEPTAAGDFDHASDIHIDPTTGDARNYSNMAGSGVIEVPFPGTNIWSVTIPGPNPPNGSAVPFNYFRMKAANRTGTPTIPTAPPISGTGAGLDPLGPFTATPGTSGRAIFEMGDLANIRSLSDTHLYKFRAIYTGTAEVRLDTTDLADEFFEGLVTNETNDPAQPPPPAPATVTTLGLTGGFTASTTRTYNSPLDGALRIFNNDFQQVIYNDDNGVTAGESDTTNAGDFAGKTFQRRDPRVVFAVEAGKDYFIQVESGQARFAATPERVDWRHVTGSYELLVNSMPSTGFEPDDHFNVIGPRSTPIPTDLTITSATATLGSVDGELLDTANNPTDFDTFSFVSPAAGTATFSVARRFDDSFGKAIRVIDAASNTLLGTATAGGTGTASLSVAAKQGQKFWVIVAGDPFGAEGRYTVSVKGVPARDDHADDLKFARGTIIPKDTYDFDKTETVTGRIENTGDTDTFTFNTLSFDLASITVHSLSGAFTPFVRVYELSEDPDGNPIRLQIGWGGATAPGGDAQTTVSTTAPPRTSLNTGDSYPTYFVVVSGADPNFDIGDYTLTLAFGNATDDHPDFGQQAQIRDPEDVIAIGAGGFGGSNGTIEESGDTDLFTFVNGPAGTVTVNVVVADPSRLHASLRVFDSAGNPMTDVGTGLTTVVAPDQEPSVGTFRFIGESGARYYVLIQGEAPGVVKTSDHGAYFVNVGTPTPDDHPNEGEFALAHDIPIAPSTGAGLANGVLEISSDTDLFKFTALGDGNGSISVDTPGSGFTPAIKLYNPDTSLIGVFVDGGAGDEDGVPNGSVVHTIPVAEGSTYYILVLPSPAATGSYTVSLATPRPNGSLPDDHANAGDWDHATPIPLSVRTGDGTSTGIIETIDDTDLFVFSSLSGTAQRPRKAFVQVITPSGSVLDAGVKVFGPDHSLLSEDTAGGPGYNAGVSFDIDGANQSYWVEVDGVDLTGGYTVKVDTAPETYFLYYPEGFSNTAIHEYVSIGNANDFDVSYTVRLRYENTGNEVVLADNATIVGHSRGGITISDGVNGALPGVLANAPYSIIVESDGFLAANISHYDFHATLGEAFTGRTSTLWSFARGERTAGVSKEFVVFYNPNPTPADVTLTAYRSDGGVVSFTQTVGGERRGGWNINQLAAIGPGQFAFTVTSAPTNSGDEHIGIVAALSHYDLVNRTGYGHLGDPDGGSTVGLVPGIIESATVHTRVTLFNPTDTPASVNLVSRYMGSSIPDAAAAVTVEPHSFLSLTGTDLNLTNNQLAGLRYESNVPITVTGGTVRPGSTPPDALTDITRANTDIASNWSFGDAFINRSWAGTLYFENLYLYNPDSTDLDVTLKFVFNDGFSDSISVHVLSNNFAAVALHQVNEILSHRVFNFFSVEASADRPFAVKMNHYDLVLDGAWGSTGGPLGIANPLSQTT